MNDLSQSPCVHICVHMQAWAGDTV